MILVDPWIQTNPMCPEALKILDRVDTMLITHGHFDHIADAVDIGKKFSPKSSEFMRRASGSNQKA